MITSHVCQAKVTTRVTIGQLGVVQPQQIQNRCMQVMQMYFVDCREISVVICLSVGQSAADPSARKAFDLTAESDRTRGKYGQTTFGQGCLLARRLAEAHVPYVQVNWSEYV